jgi:hypothetical protein
VFTIIAAFWTQVDYRTRQMQPWEEMAKGPQPAANSLLLDYISPNPAIAFFYSFKHRHLPVAITLFGSALLKILMVVSTSIFVLESVVVSRSLSMDMKEQFDFSGFNASNVNDIAGLAYAGTALNEIGYLPGTNAEYAAELFEASKPMQADAYSLTTSSKTFIADLTCEPATLDPNVTAYCASSDCTIEFNIMVAHNENCHMSTFPQDNTSFMLRNSNPFGDWYGGVLPGTCDGKADEMDLERLVVYLLYKKRGTVISNSTALFCKPSFQLQQSIVTVDQNGALKSVNSSVPLPAPEGLTTFSLYNAVRKTVSQLDINLNAELERKYTTRIKVPDMFMGLILRTADSDDIAIFWDSKMIAQGAQKVFRSVAAQVAKRYLLVPTSTTLADKASGSGEYKQERLFMRQLTLRALELLLCVLSLLCLYLAFRRTRHTTPQDPASIARITVMISQSHDLKSLMSSHGSSSLNILQTSLIGRYGVAYVNNISAKDSTAPYLVIENHHGQFLKQIFDVVRYWQPLSARWYSRIALLIVPLCIIVALEIVYRQSQSGNGLVDVASTKLTQYGSDFVPALVMIMTKLLFSSSDFDLRIMDPYVQLKKGFARAKTTVLDKTIYTWKTDAFWTAFKNGRIAVGASTLSVIVASFLTVAASGLYSTTPIAHQRTMSLIRLDSFYDPASMVSNLNGTFNFITALSARLVVYDQIESPQWTSGVFVLPNLTSSSEFTDGGDEAATISVNLPVRRGNLTCEIVPPDQLTLDYNYVPGNYTSPPPFSVTPDVTIRWPMLDRYACTSSITDNRTTARLSSMVDGPFGIWTNLRSRSRSFPASCPSSYGIYGTWEDRRALELNVVLCWSTVQELQASAHFTMPGWRLRSLHVDEHTVKNISTAYDTQVDLAERVFSGTNGNISTALDAVFTVFLRNSTSNTIDTSLLQYDNFNRMYARINSVYGRATAQIMHREGRFSNLTSANTTLQATATDHSTLRLHQNLISTRILQALLSVMLVCALVSLLTIDLRKVLPKNPCSIAAQASLVAGSEMMRDMPVKAQCMGDREFEELFQGKRFKMGAAVSTGDRDGRWGIDIDKGPRVKREGR